MTLSTPMRCSALAEELDEPMIGTVDQRLRWLLVEDHSAWGHDAVGEVLGAELARSAKERRVRVLLIRRREGDPRSDAVRRAILVDTVTREMAIRSVTDLADLSLEAVADAPVASFGAPMTDPIFLVCTNGKRDACCALRGRALMSALAPGHAERTWECTHLGGHRFAGNLVCLPDGILYGRVSAADGPRLADAYLDGRLDPRALRGRSAWPQPAQVAERALRLGLELDGLEAVALERVDLAGDRATVTLAATSTGAEHAFELVREAAGEPRPTSCRADELETPGHWRVVASTI
jgi:hypothetical protein